MITGLLIEQRIESPLYNGTEPARCLRFQMPWRSTSIASGIVGNVLAVPIGNIHCGTTSASKEAEENCPG